MTGPRARSHGFSLIELMVASAAALVVLSGAISLATAMVRFSRGLADDQALSNDLALARQFLTSSLGNIGYGWSLDAQPSTCSTSTGAPGPGLCVASTGLCAVNGSILPLQLTNSSTGPDALRAIVPRDPDIETVAIQTLSDGSALPGDCALAAPIGLAVVGITTKTWQAGDLVVVAKFGNVSVARVAADFSANATSPAPSRTLSLDLGGANALRLDDGLRSLDATCSALVSLQSAVVFRIKEVRMRVSGTNLEIAEIATAAAAAAPTFQAVLDGVDDLQIQLEVAKFPKDASGGTAESCLCNGSAALECSAFGAACTCIGTDRLNIATAANNANRLIGLRFGLKMRGALDTVDTARAVGGLFDRSGTVITDKKRHRDSFIYVGLPNAFVL
ncbi:MAG: prepilin-type N-terminal cleavage/methylation domain-containing protein [Deltaproteobacteria bacterium]|nr:prepilin-type N-terminal cleavage/methylation domain-containing protein [Deltaproteobacteria bacterium]